MVQHRCSSFDDNASSHCRLPTMFLTAQAQLSRSKYNSGRGRGRKLENVQNTREILQPPPLRVSQRRLCRKTRAIRGSHNRCWTPNNSGLLPSWSSDSCELPSTRSPLPVFLKLVFRTPSYLARLLLPPSPAAGRTQIPSTIQPPHPRHTRKETSPKQKTPTVLPPKVAQGQSVEEPHNGRRPPKNDGPSANPPTSFLRPSNTSEPTSLASWGGRVPRFATGHTCRGTLALARSGGTSSNIIRVDRARFPAWRKPPPCVSCVVVAGP